MSLTHRTGTFVGISCSKYSFLGRRKSDNLFLNVPFFYTDYIPVASLPLCARPKSHARKIRMSFKKFARRVGVLSLPVGVSSSLTLSVLATSAGDFNLIENKNFRATSALLRDSVHLHFEWFWARFLVKVAQPLAAVCFVSPKNPADSLSVYVLRYVWKHGPWSSGNKLEKRETLDFDFIWGTRGPWERSGGRRLSLGAPRLIPLETINWTIDLQS